MKNFTKTLVFYVAIILLIVVGVRFFGQSPNSEVEIAFNTFMQNLESDNIKSLETTDNKITGISRKNEKFITYMPEVTNSDELKEDIRKKIDKNDVKITEKPKPQTPPLLMHLPTILIVVGFAIFIMMMLQLNQGGGGGKVSNFGRSRAKLHKDDHNQVKFKDVAGLDEEKEELEEIVEFLKNPHKFLTLGARIPKGILLVGPPGTGKTYLSKAVAGEAGVPFFSISGSDFVEMFVGVGASRVRDLFNEAKKVAPAIVFIDEIDAVGRKRGAGLGGGHDEREQTLNQLLVEMDGFGINQGVIIMAATNRPDILDPALLRPGRFDRQVMVGNPDIKAREAILAVHSRNKPLDSDVNLKTLAKRTPGFTPADIENLMNEAALLTARQNRKKINMDTIEEAITKVIAGIPKRSRVITEKERRLTAYHEAGHAVVATVLPTVDPVHQVTIIPRGMAGGFTMILPEEEKYYATRNEMHDELSHLLGGRVAESIVLDDISTGAQNDLQRVSDIARAMVTKYAFSENLASMSFGDSSDEVFLGKDFTTRRNYSEEVASEIDKEIERIVQDAYNKTKEILTENIDKLHYVAKALLKYETLDAPQFKEAFEGTLDISEDIEDDKKAKDDSCEKEVIDLLNDGENEDTKEDLKENSDGEIVIDLEKDDKES